MWCYAPNSNIYKIVVLKVWRNYVFHCLPLKFPAILLCLVMPPLVALVCPMMAPPGLHDGPSYITAPSFSQGLTNFQKASDAVPCYGLTINCKPVCCRTHYPRYILPLQRPALQWCGRVGKFTEVKWSLVRFKLFQKGWNTLRTGVPVELSNL